MDELHPYVRYFAKELRRLRQAHGWTQEALGNRLDGWQEDTISLIEREKRIPALKLAQALDAIFPEVDGNFERLLREAGVDGDDEWFTASWVTWEKRASVLKTFEALVVPGLLQTKDYARAINTPWLAVDSDVDLDAELEERLERQAIFDQKVPPIFTAIIREQVLTEMVGSVQVMREQLAHLLERSEEPRTTVQVLPAGIGAHVGLSGAFIIASFSDDTPDMVYLESSDRGDITRNPDRCARMEATWNALRSEALDVRATRDRILRIQEETWKDLRPHGASPATAPATGATA